MYPNLNRPGAEDFRQKVWGLYSMIGSYLIIGSLGVSSVTLVGARPNYRDFDIRIDVLAGERTPHSLSLPVEVHSNDRFLTWRKNCEVLILRPLMSFM